MKLIRNRMELGKECKAPVLKVGNKIFGRTCSPKFVYGFSRGLGLPEKYDPNQISESFFKKHKKLPQKMTNLRYHENGWK